jgi:hypothetical protein
MTNVFNNANENLLMRNTLNNISEIKRQLFSLEHESELLDELKENIRTFATKVQSNLQIEALTCSTQVIQALICDIHIGKNYIKINNRFGKFKKEA